VRHSSLVSRWSSVQIQQSLRQLNRNQAHSASVVRCVAGGFSIVLCLRHPYGRGLKRVNHFPCESPQIGPSRFGCGRLAIGGIARPREKAARLARALRADRVPNMCRHQTAFLRGMSSFCATMRLTTCAGLSARAASLLNCSSKNLSRLAFSSGLFPLGT
jgi:hypothetical protein